MERSIFLLCILLLTLCLYNEKAEAKVQGENKDKIEWEENGKDKKRSIFPIEGYVEDGVVTIYLYACPEAARVSVIDLEGNLVNQNVCNSAEKMKIDLMGLNGTFEIIVEYDGKVFKAEIEI